MPLFLIRRDVPGITQEEVDAASFRAITCSFYFSGLRWLTSYWDREAGAIHCVYEARSAEDVFEHAEVARIPCNDVRPVEQFGPENYTDEDVVELAQNLDR
jgi:hypothetical protein